jgi:Tat protein secretion system quality control protein TatD with DNase activity
MYSSKFGGRAGRSKKMNPKASNKKKCPFCGAKGHDGDACPKKDATGVTTPIVTVIGGAGSGISHKTSRKATTTASSCNKAKDGSELMAGDDHGLTVVNDNPYFVFDAGCDVGASIDGLAILLKVPEKKCVSTYHAAIAGPLYGGAICRQYIKANKPWKKDSPRVLSMMEADPNLFFVIGLGHAYLEAVDDDEDDNDEYERAIEALADAMDEDERVVGFCAKLDYAPEMTVRTAIDTQLRRLKATCQAAIQESVPIQIRVGTVDDDDTQVKVMKDLARVLLDVIPADDEEALQVHLSCWSGKSETMLKLLTAFPDTLYIGMSPAVGFAKASVAHECAFDLPLNRLVLETDNVIPAPVTKAMGRKAFSHSGLVPYCALAIAEQKKISPEEVARAASENTIGLYGRGLIERSKQALVEAEARIERQKQLDLERAGEEEAAAAAGAESGNEDEPDAKQKKKKKKKKGGVDQNQEETERNIDDEILSSMLMDSDIGP